jgi:hypothetical protein
MVCPTCYSSHLRLSKFRSEDLGLLFTFKYPLRCKSCGERSYGNLFKAMGLPRAHSHQATAKDESEEKVNSH